MTCKHLAATLLMFALAANIFAAKPLRSKGSHFVINCGDELPHFSFSTYAGDSFDSDFLRGQTVLIQFASSWCSLSREQLKETELFCQQMTDNEHFSCIIFNIEDSPADTVAFLARCAEDNLTLPIAFDQQDRIYNLFASPHGTATRSIVVDATGRIAYLSNTYSRKAFAKIKKRILKLTSSQR